MAKGDCPNECLRSADIRQPLHSTELKAFPLRSLRTIYEYDVKMKPGMELTFLPSL